MVRTTGQETISVSLDKEEQEDQIQVSTVKHKWRHLVASVFCFGIECVVLCLDWQCFSATLFGRC